MEDSTNTLSSGLGTVANNTYDYINNLLLNPSVIIILVIVLILYGVLFMSLGDSILSSQSSSSVAVPSNSNSNSNSNSGTAILTIILVAFFIVLIIINGLQYFFGLDIIATLKNLFTENPEVDIKVDTSRAEAIKAPVPEILLRKQVFNIPENDYIYSDAKALCSAYGSRLATYKEVEETYKDGG